MLWNSRFYSETEKKKNTLYRGWSDLIWNSPMQIYLIRTVLNLIKVRIILQTVEHVSTYLKQISAATRMMSNRAPTTPPTIYVVEFTLDVPGKAKNTVKDKND